MSIANSGYMSHIVNSLKNMKNLQELKTGLKIVNNKTSTGFASRQMEGITKIDGKFYP